MATTTMISPAFDSGRTKGFGDPFPIVEPPRISQRTYGQDFVLTLWTADPELARRADQAGVDRIGLDLETLGKAERQKGLATWISPHRVEQLPALREALTNGARLFARTNPVNAGTRDEVETLLAHGAQVLMLPMFATAREVAHFIDCVNGRCEVVLLLECRAAAERVEEIVKVRGINDIHVGLNDLTLSLGLPNRFAALSSPLMERISKVVRGAGIRFGFGGIGRWNDVGLPVPSDLIYAQYPRLGAKMALISRAFLNPDPATIDLTSAIQSSRQRLDHWHTCSRHEMEMAHDLFRFKVDACSTW